MTFAKTCILLMRLLISPDVLHWYMLHRTSLVYMDMIGLSCQLKVICVICYRPLCLLMTC